MDAYQYSAICKTCRVEIISSTQVSCPLCDRSLLAHDLYQYGPASIGLSMSSGQETGTGGSVFPSKKRIKEKIGKLELVVTSELCDICGAIPPLSSDVHPFRIGRTHYAACDACYKGLNLVRLPRTKFSGY